MPPLPIERMKKRYLGAQDESDQERFNELMHYGEFVCKLIVLGMVGAINTSTDGHRYSLEHALVRADGIGEWARQLQNALTGQASQYLQESAYTEQNELTTKCDSNTWQFQCMSTLNESLIVLDSKIPSLPARVQASQWVEFFSRLRNKTRGHGAVPSGKLAKVCVPLEKSIDQFVDNFFLFKREWVHLRRNLSGKYKVTKLTGSDVHFKHLRTDKETSLRNGIYIHFDHPSRIDLLFSDDDITDFSVPNGGFSRSKFELISYISGEISAEKNESYLKPATPLPESETAGIGQLDILGKAFSNLPSPLNEYVERPVLESEMNDALNDEERYPIVTLHGRGGIGKTVLSLKVIGEILATERFGLAIWFSSRDIDLLQEGPRSVRPQVLRIGDIAQDYVHLTENPNKEINKTDAEKIFANHLRKSPLGKTLFVFDNFETLSNPTEVFAWIETHIRLPNKALITTRHRDFKADYPIEIRGMTDDECRKLIEITASKWSILNEMPKRYKTEIVEESQGHPYVVKVLLGEAARTNKFLKVDRILGNSAEMLTALFERTYSRLSPSAQACFLTLVSWRSVVADLALEAVFLTGASDAERIDVYAGLDELERYSFIEIEVPPETDIKFISVPLVAATFGQRKLRTSAMRRQIDQYAKALQDFGALQQSGIKHGIQPLIDKLFSAVAEKVETFEYDLKKSLPMLEFVAEKSPKAWIKIADFYEQYEDDSTGSTKSILALQRYIETSPAGYEQFTAWKRIGKIARRQNRLNDELEALISMSQVAETPFYEISTAANYINSISNREGIEFEEEIKNPIITDLAFTMTHRIDEGDATDRSRLAWLLLHLGREVEAREHATEGLLLDQNNVYCQRILRNLSP